MARNFSFILVCGLFFVAAVSAQEAQKEKKILKNADIVMMVQNHFDDDTLVKVIEVSDTDFDISGDALITLKNQGVSSPVLRVMLQATQRKKLAAAAAATPPANPAPAAKPPAAPPNDSRSPSPADSRGVSGNNLAGPPAVAPAANAVDPAPNNPASPAANKPVPDRPAPPASMNAMQGMQGMGINQQELAQMQSVLSAMGMGGMFGGSFSMGNYSREQMPHVFLMAEHNRARQEVSPSTAEMAQTKYKSGAPGPGGTMLRTLATEGLSFAAIAGGPGGMMAMSAFSMASGFMPGMRPGAPSMTYVWGLPGRKSARELTDTDPRFELTYGDIPGVDPDAFEPVLVKLVQSRDNYRLVGATRTKMNMKNTMSGNGPENDKWISEERWPTRVYKEERGFYVLRVDQPLEPGEYAVVLRPVKGYKVKPSGLGGHAQVFYSVWDFSVPGASPVEASSKKKK